MSNACLGVVVAAEGGAQALWPGHYSAWDQEAVADLAAWIAGGPGRSLAELSRLSGVNRATLSLCLGGKYSAAPTEHLRTALEAVRVQEERAAQVRTVPFVAGTLYRMLGIAVRRARLYRNFAVVCAAVGTGKTRAARELARTMPGLILIEADGEMTAGALLDELGAQLGTKMPAWAAAGAKMGAAIRALKGSTQTILVDEAETLIPAHRRADGRRTLEDLRRIRDKAEIGIVLIGTEGIDEVIGTSHFDQLRSRVGARSPLVRKIAREDADGVVRAALADQGEAVTQAVLDACWEVCAGSMRVLAEGLLPSLYLDGIDRGKPLCQNLVRAIARDVLRLKA